VIVSKTIIATVLNYYSKVLVAVCSSQLLLFQTWKLE